jgi:DNA-binding IclR family transcriptional regulator
MKKPNRIPTNLRALRILEVLGRSEGAMTATEINAELNLPRQTVHRLCVTLEENGFIIRKALGKKYQIARRLRSMGAGLLHNSRDYIARHQVLLSVNEHVGETVNYAVPGAYGMSYVDRVETDWAFRIQQPIGTSVPFHCTASGKCFLASLAKDHQLALVESLELTAMTQNTLTDKSLLLEELRDIKTNGYALDREEFMSGLIAIAVPIFDAESRFVAGLAYHGPTQRLNLSSMIESKDILITSAQKLEKILFLA